jgi:hypothetical protein
MTQIMKMPSVQSAMQGVGWTDSNGVPHTLPEMHAGAHFDGYWQFYGLVSEEVDNFRAANGGKQPNPQDVQKIVNEAFAKITLKDAQPPSLFNWGGTPATTAYQFQVPPDVEAKIRAGFAQAGINNPSEEMIGEQYARGLRAQGVLR